MGIVVFSTLCIIIFNLIVDMVYAWIDPRIRLSLMALLEVRDLRTSFRTDDGVVKAVDGVTFAVEKGKTLGIVGESGCGKSVTCLTIMGLNNPRNTISSGEALFKGENLLAHGQQRAARPPRQRHRDDLPGSDDVAEPGALDRQAARRGGHAAPRRLEEGGAASARSSS